MKLYKRMVKPIIVSPNQHVEFLSQDVENDDIWYEEELIPELRNKFSKDKRICEPFIYLSFRDKYVEVNGNCMICGKSLTGNNLFICEECQKK